MGPIKELRLWNFRVWREASIALDDKNVIVGPNGSGKSSIAEATALVALLKSPRTSNLTEVVSFGEAQGGVAVEASTTFEVRFGEGGTKSSIGGQPAASRKFLGRFKCVVFGPEDLDLVLGDPPLRRRALDDVASQTHPAHRAVRLEFDKALRQRNAALKLGQEDQAQAYDVVYAKAAAELIARRREVLEGLYPHAANAFGDLAGRGNLRLEYKCQMSDVEPHELEGALIERLQADMAVDLARTTTRTGPHRDDIEITIDGRSAKAFASRGEQRTAALAVRLGEVALLDATMLVLDDVASELDEDRRNRVFKSTTATQTIVTTTDLIDVGAIGAQAKVLTIRDGELHAA